MPASLPPWPSAEMRMHTPTTTCFARCPSALRVLVDPPVCRGGEVETLHAYPGLAGSSYPPTFQTRPSAMQRERCGQLVRRFEGLQHASSPALLRCTPRRSPLAEDRASHPVNPRPSSPRLPSNRGGRRDGQWARSQRPRLLQPPPASAASLRRPLSGSGVGTE